MELDEAVRQILASNERSIEATNRAETAARDAQTAANGAKAAANAATSEIQSLSHGQKVLRVHVRTMWGRLIGGEPPEPPPGVDPELVSTEKWSDPPIAKAVKSAKDLASQSSAEVDTLRGEMIAGFAEMHSVLGKQSEAMGIGQKGWEFLASKAGQRAILRNVGAVGALVAAIGAIGASCRVPAPSPVAHAPTMIVLPVATIGDAGVMTP